MLDFNFQYGNDVVCLTWQIGIPIQLDRDIRVDGLSLVHSAGSYSLTAGHDIFE